jgi:predicted ribosome quality control (RQC) complex YloA/Tae2 family protein
MRIQKIYQPEDRTVVIHGHPTPGGLPLLLRLRPDGFVTWAEPEAPNPEEPTAFCMLLRKHLCGGFLRGVQQPALDRLLVLEAERLDEDGRSRRPRLIIELTGARPNLHLVAEDDAILGTLVRYPTDRDRFGSLRRWAPPPPPPGNGLDPREAEPGRVGGALEGAPDARELARRIAGVTRPLAQLLLDTGSAQEGLAGIASTTCGQAGPFLSARSGRQVLAIAGLPEALHSPLEDAGWNLESHADLGALTRHVFLDAAREDRRERSRHECRRALERLLKKLQGQIERNTEAREKCDRADELQATGELLKASLHQITPGSRQVEVTDYSTGEPRTRNVSIDPKRSPRGNMDHYFQRAKRLRRKAPVLERKARHLARELEDGEALLLRTQDETEDPVALKEELRAAGILATQAARSRGRKQRPARNKKKKRRDLRTFVSSDGLRILVGRSNEENDYLVRKAGKKGDAWLHAEGAAGAHVLVKLPGRSEKVPPRTLEEAAQLAAHFSKLRYEAKARIMLSKIGVVKRAPNSPPGQVLVPKFETIVVSTDPGVVRRLAPLGE